MWKPISESLGEQHIFLLLLNPVTAERKHGFRSHIDNPHYPIYFHIRRKDGVRAQNIFLEVYDGSAK